MGFTVLQMDANLMLPALRIHNVADWQLRHLAPGLYFNRFRKHLQPLQGLPQI